MKNLVWLLLNTPRWAEPLTGSTEDRNHEPSREESDRR